MSSQQLPAMATSSIEKGSHKIEASHEEKKREIARRPVPPPVFAGAGVLFDKGVEGLAHHSMARPSNVFVIPVKTSPPEVLSGET